MLTQLRKLNNYESFMKEMVSMLSMKKLKENFGVVIKKQKNSEKFNLYKNGELIFADINEFEIAAIVEVLGYKIAEMVSSEATIDTNTEKVAKKIAEQEHERSEYRMCPECGGRYHKSESHYHRVGAD